MSKSFSHPSQLVNLTVTDYPSWKYDFDCRLGAKQFLNWKRDELRTVTLEYTRKRKGGKKRNQIVHQKFSIPAAYHQLVYQLVSEIDLADDHDFHEARRRQVYARQILDLFGQELLGFRGYTPEAMVAFRSKILTPILVRQLWGIDDAFTPYVEAAIKGTQQDLTIEAVTTFYLKDDPADPSLIPTYRRNLLYVPMARWCLGRAMWNPDSPKAIDYYRRFLDDHDDIIDSLKQTGLQGEDENGFPLLTDVEAAAIGKEDLEIFFKKEMERLVRPICSQYHSSYCY